MTFQELYDQRPIVKNHGGSGYSNLKNLYDIIQDLKPKYIVESGTWKGQTSWLFNQFATVTCHDIQFAKLEWRSQDIEYVKEDISNYIYPTEDTLFFFDDHISQLARLKWLLDIGAEWAVFDDNQPRSIAETLKNPPSPTLQMLMDSNAPITKFIKEYRVMPFHGVDRNFNPRLTLIRL